MLMRISRAIFPDEFELLTLTPRRQNQLPSVNRFIANVFVAAYRFTLQVQNRLLHGPELII